MLFRSVVVFLLTTTIKATTQKSNDDEDHEDSNNNRGSDDGHPSLPTWTLTSMMEGSIVLIDIDHRGRIFDFVCKMRFLCCLCFYYIK